MLSSWNCYEQAMRDSLLNESEDKIVTLAKDPYLLARRFRAYYNIGSLSERYTDICMI